MLSAKIFESLLISPDEIDKAGRLRSDAKICVSVFDRLEIRQKLIDKALRISGDIKINIELVSFVDPVELLPEELG